MVSGRLTILIEGPNTFFPLLQQSYIIIHTSLLFILSCKENIISCISQVFLQELTMKACSRLPNWV